MPYISKSSFQKSASRCQRRFSADSNSEKLDRLFPFGRPSKASGRLLTNNIYPKDMAIPFGRQSMPRWFKLFKLAFAQTSQQRVRMLFRVREESNVPNAYGKKTTNVWTSGLHRLDASTYYRIYMQQKCNRSDAWATPFGHGPNLVLREARYGKPVAQLSVRTLSATVWTPPREIHSRLNLSLLSL